MADDRRLVEGASGNGLEVVAEASLCSAAGRRQRDQLEPSAKQVSPTGMPMIVRQSITPSAISATQAGMPMKIV
jgi:hypothetical protein